MDDMFKIYVDQLRDGHVEQVDETFTPDFLDVKEKELTFQDPVTVTGQAYLAEDMLVLHFTISALAIMPCSVCNDLVKVPIKINEFYHAEPLAEIKSGVFNFKELLRESILLDTPTFAECGGGKCPHRKEIDKYMKKPSPKSKPQKGADEDDGYKPFAHFKWDSTKETK